MSVAKDIKSDVKLIRIFTYNEKKCYEIDQLLQNMQSVLANVNSSMRKSIPVKHRYVIDAETFLIRAQESFSADNKSIMQLQYVDFEPMPELTDDIFQLPTGFEIISPKTIQEYVQMTADLISPKPVIQRLPPAIPQFSNLPPPNKRNTNKDTVVIPKKMSNAHKAVIAVNLIVIAAIIAYFI